MSKSLGAHRSPATGETRLQAFAHRRRWRLFPLLVLIGLLAGVGQTSGAVAASPGIGELTLAVRTPVQPFSIGLVDQQAQKGFFVFDLDGYGGAIFVGQYSDIGPGSVPSCGPCTATPKILSVLAGPFGSTDGANYDLCKNSSNYHGGSDLSVSRIDAYGHKGLDADNMPDCSQYQGAAPPNVPIAQGPGAGNNQPGNQPQNPPPSSLMAHLDCGNYVEVQAPAAVPAGEPTNSGLPSPCDVIIDSYDHFGAQICVTAPAADPLEGLTPDGIVVSSPSSCEDAAFLEPDWFETYSACPVSGICVFPPQRGSVIPSIAAAPGLHPINIMVTQGNANVPLVLQVNVLPSLVTNPPFPFGVCPTGATGVLAPIGPGQFTLTVTNPGSDSYISYVRLENSINASPVPSGPVWDTTPGSGGALGTYPLQVESLGGQTLNPQGNPGMNATVPGGGAVTVLVLIANPAASQLNPGEQVLVTAYFANFYASCELQVTVGGPAGSSQAPGTVSGSGIPGGGNSGSSNGGTSGPGGSGNPGPGTGTGSSNGGTPGSGGSGGPGTSNSGGTPSNSSPSSGGTGASGVTDVPSCTKFVQTLGLSSSNAAAACQAIGAAVPPGGSFGTVFTCVYGKLSTGVTPAAALSACSSGGSSGSPGSNSGSPGSGPSSNTGSPGSNTPSNTGSSSSGGSTSCPGNYAYTSAGGCLIPGSSSSSSSSTGSSSTGGPTPDAELDLYYSDQRGDNFTTATAQGRSDAIAAGYRYVRIEGWAFSTQQAGTVPLNLYYSDARHDNFSTATAKGASDALAAGYRFVRVEAYVYPTQQPGTVPLNLYYSDARQDNFSTATAQGASDAQAAGYRYVRVEGYVYPASYRSGSSSSGATSSSSSSSSGSSSPGGGSPSGSSSSSSSGSGSGSGGGAPCYNILGLQVCIQP